MTGKRTFSSAERYAVWLHHEKRCWLCLEPLRLVETTIDHVLPESLLDDPDELANVLAECGLSENFNINGFENWLPCHQHCNQKKGKSRFRFVPAYQLILERLMRVAPSVQKTAETVGANAETDKVIGYILAALERQAITWDELQVFLGQEQRRPAEMIHLDNGYWLHKNDVARECDCQCERVNCLDNTGKVHCYFSRMLSDWVIGAGLYWKCYDEIIACPRCQQSHKRGHIGRKGICGNPYSNQARQADQR
jgi:hypothetical protein